MKNVAVEVVRTPLVHDHCILKFEDVLSISAKNIAQLAVQNLQWRKKKNYDKDHSRN